MKIDNKVVLLDLWGKELTASETEMLTLGMALAGIILSAEGTNRMKMYNLAQKFYNDESTTIDSSDFEMIKSAIEGTKIYNTLVAWQLLDILLKIKNKEEANPPKEVEEGKK